LASIRPISGRQEPQTEPALVASETASMSQAPAAMAA
jgi:hypothetical protein